MRLIAVRHTNVALPEGVCYGKTDVDTATTFESEARIVVEILNSFSFERIYSSPLTRCTRLAEKIMNGISFLDQQDKPGFINMGLIVDDRLKELDFGEWELQPWKSINREELDEWAKDYFRIRCPGGESFGEMINRVEIFLSEIVKIPGDALIVTHSGVIRCIHYIVNCMPSEEIFKIKIPFGSISIFNLQ